METEEQQTNYIVVDDGTEYKENQEIDDEKELIAIKQEESFFESAFNEMRESLMENDPEQEKAKKEEELKKKKKEKIIKEWEIV